VLAQLDRSDLKDLPAHKDLLDLLDYKEPLVLPELKDLLALLDHKDLKAHLVIKDQEDLAEVMAHLEHLDKMGFPD
jgi:hypothetical protein